MKDALEEAVGRAAEKRRQQKVRMEERERCARIAENPGFIQAQDTEWDAGVNYAKKFIAAAIRAHG